MDVAHTDTQAAADILVQKNRLGYFPPPKKIFNLLFSFKEDCLSRDCSARLNELYFPLATSCKVHSNYDCTFGNDYSYHMMGSAASD